jgi:2,3-bisphosphoglycerate-independent phosphoglycerate mutase
MLLLVLISNYFSIFFFILETHKYGHVTYFWNGNKSGYVNEKLELFYFFFFSLVIFHISINFNFKRYEQITSLPNADTEFHPEMKAVEV